MSREESEKYIKAAQLFIRTPFLRTNTPTQYADRQYQYMADRTALFNQQRAYLSTDFVTARIQGLDESNFYEWRTENIRLADVSSLNRTSMTARKIDDYKEILFESPWIKHIPAGAKIETMGSTWIVFNPQDMSTPVPTAIIARCNATYNFYDDYGNVVKEPIVILRTEMSGNRNAQEKNMVLMSGYFDVICQLNPNTERLNQNKRLIWGDKAYNITGYSDFAEEYTGDTDSAHFVSFTARVEEPNKTDDLDLKIAGGKDSTFEAVIDGLPKIAQYQEAPLTPKFVRDGEEIPATAAFPLTWQYSVSPSGFVDVGGGSMVGINVGTAEITATLKENPDITAHLSVEVKGVGSSIAHIKFDAYAPSELRCAQYSQRTYHANTYLGTQAKNYPLDWTFSGADPSDYTAEIAPDGLSVTISCINPSDNPLVITAYSDVVDRSASISVELVGY